MPARARARRCSSGSPGSSSSCPASEVSGAWLGARLHFREGSAPLGYIPGANWTKVLCDGVTPAAGRARASRVRLNATRQPAGHRGRPRARSRAEHRRADRRRRLRQHDPDRAVPPAARRRPHARARADPVLRADLRRLRHASAGGPARLLDQPGLARPDRLRHLSAELAQSDHRHARATAASTSSPTCAAATGRCSTRRTTSCWRAIATISGRCSASSWSRSGPRSSRVPMYSPVFGRGFRNPPIRSASWENVYFGGQLPHVSVDRLDRHRARLRPRDRCRACSGTWGAQTDLPAQASDFRLAAMPRA